ncbi:MAG: hypothetical protein PHR82_05180 [Endomicrobiaceae bacterium]|nr:hypothetical protein [Endomicrobiaceae bacterium]
MSLILSSVVFSVGNKKSVREIVKSDSVISDFFAVNSMSDGLIKDMMDTKTHKQSRDKEDKQQVNKEIGIMVTASSVLFNLEEINKQFFSSDKIVNFSINREIQYPLKIPFNRDLIFIIMLFGLIFMGLARSVPVILKIKFKELMLRSASISSFYLWGIYEKF